MHHKYKLNHDNFTIILHEHTEFPEKSFFTIQDQSTKYHYRTPPSKNINIPHLVHNKKETMKLHIPTESLLNRIAIILANEHKDEIKITKESEEKIFLKFIYKHGNENFMVDCLLTLIKFDGIIKKKKKSLIPYEIQPIDLKRDREQRSLKTEFSTDLWNINNKNDNYYEFK